MWIDNDICMSVGDTGFLIERYSTNTGSQKFVLSNRPAYTNQSHQPRLTGWCGETNNISVTAHGIAVVVKTADTTQRMLVRSATKSEIVDFLEKVGFPELYQE